MNAKKLNMLLEHSTPSRCAFLFGAEKMTIEQKDFLIDSLFALTIELIAQTKKEGIDSKTLNAITESIKFLITNSHEVSQDYHNPIL